MVYLGILAYWSIYILNDASLNIQLIYKQWCWGMWPIFWKFNNREETKVLFSISVLTRSIITLIWLRLWWLACALVWKVDLVCTRSVPYLLREWLFNTLGRGELGEGGGLELFFDQRGRFEIFFQTLKGGCWIFLHASLANRFYKWEKKAVFIFKNNWIWIYKIWAWGMGWILFLQAQGDCLSHSKGIVIFCGVVIFPTPSQTPTSIKWPLLYIF